MQNNPFEEIVLRLEKLQSTIDLISVNLPKEKPIRQENPHTLLNLKDVASILKVPVNTARYYIEKKKLPAVKSGKAFKIRQSDFLEWVDQVFLKKEETDNVTNDMGIAPARMREIHHRFKKA